MRTRYKHSRSAGWKIPFAILRAGYQPGCVKDTAQPVCVRGSGNDLSEPKAVCLSLLSLLAASSPQSGFTEPFPFAAFLAGDWLQKAKGQHPSEPAPGFTLPWVDRSCAQCRTPETAGAKFYNTPPSGRCTPEYELKGYQLHL